MLFSPGFEEGGGGALTVHPYWVLVSIVQFLLLFYLLRRFLWGPVLRTLRDRAARIREGLELAEAAKADRERLKAEVERLLAAARVEAQAIADRTTRAAEEAAAAIRAQAKAEADRIRERGRIEAEQLHDQALAQLRSEFAGMVVLAAGRVLGREVNAEQHRELIERSIEEAGAQLSEARPDGHIGIGRAPLRGGPAQPRARRTNHQTVPPLARAARDGVGSVDDRGTPRSGCPDTAAEGRAHRRFEGRACGGPDAPGAAARTRPGRAPPTHSP